MGQWEEMQLGDFVELKRGYDLPKKNRRLGDIPLVSSAGLSDTHSESKVKGPGVITGRYGTIGQVFYIENDFWPLNTTLYVKDFKGNDPLFVYYFIKTIKYRDYSDKAAVPGVNRNHLHKAKIIVPVDLGEQREIAIKLWSLDKKIELNRQINQTLEHIAQAIFKSWFVDFEPVKAKIQAKQNGQDPERAAMCAISGKTDAELDAFLKASTPEHDAQGSANVAGGRMPGATRQQLTATAALFPDELEDSDLGPLPRGWSWKSLEEVVNLNPRRVLKKGQIATYLDMKNMPTRGHLAKAWWQREMGSGTKFINGDVLLARITPCLENGKTAFVDFLKDSEVGWGSTEYIVMRAKEPLPFEYVYLLARENSFRNFAIQSMTGTSGRQRVNAAALRSYPLAISDKEGLYRDFASLVNGIMTQSKALGDQSKTLSLIRDALLPKLLSGEITAANNQVLEGITAC